MNDINHEWVGSRTDQYSKIELLMTARYICMTYSYSLRVYKRFWVYFQCLIDGINLGKHDRRETHVLVTGDWKIQGREWRHIASSYLGEYNLVRYQDTYVVVEVSRLNQGGGGDPPSVTWKVI